jgi:hypothetical protein
MATITGNHRSVLDDKSLTHQKSVTPIIWQSRDKTAPSSDAPGKRKTTTHLSWSEVVQSRPGGALKVPTLFVQLFALTKWTVEIRNIFGDRRTKGTNGYDKKLNMSKISCANGVGALKRPSTRWSWSEVVPSPVKARWCCS